MMRWISVREVVLVGVAMAGGWWLSDARTVRAASPETLYQFNGISPNTSLTVWNAEERAIYVYQGVTSGNSHVNCSYKIVVSKPGAPVDRENCAVGSLFGR